MIDLLEITRKKSFGVLDTNVGCCFLQIRDEARFIFNLYTSTCELCIELCISNERTL